MAKKGGFGGFVRFQQQDVRLKQIGHWSYLHICYRQMTL